MTTMTLPRPVRLDADGEVVPRVEVPSRHMRGDDAPGIEESWARLSLGAACGFTAGMACWHFAPYVGWWFGLVDGFVVVAGLALAVWVAHLVTPFIQGGLHRLRLVVSSMFWQLGFRSPRRGPWLPPLPWWPQESMVVIPWHGHLDRDSVIVRHVRIARPAKWVLIYREGLIVAAAQIRGQEWATPRRLAWAVGRLLGITARTYRTYAAGHSRLSALHIGGIWTIPQPVTLTALGITGPVGSHRYIGGVS